MRLVRFDETNALSVELATLTVPQLRLIYDLVNVLAGVSVKWFQL